MFWRLVRSRIWVTSDLLGRLEQAAESASPLETGGMLVGYEPPKNSAEIVVTGQIAAGPDAYHSKARFEPDGAWQEERLAEMYRSSGRVATYVGDWHSHPRTSPVPSALDRETIARVARTRAARAPRPLMLILGQTPDGWDPQAYRYRFAPCAADRV